ncbi:MAG: hypothetical protein HQL74_02870 [Magnetococcales bacterium]|nr:hypothetical protein [Magnetococcales bacterium]
MIFPSKLTSEYIKETLAEENAEKFRRNSFNRTVRIYEGMVKRGLTSGDVSGVLRLDEYILISAIDSAYLDLKRSDTFHDLSEGPSHFKKGAALACWINRLRPVQFLSRVNLITSEDVYMINSVLALRVGLTMMWVYDIQKIIGSKGIDEDSFLEHSEDYIPDGKLEKKMKEIVYTFSWRFPDFRTVTTFFKFLDNPWVQITEPHKTIP